MYIPGWERVRGVGFLQRKMHSMNFVEVSGPLQAELSEENPSLDSDIAPEEHPNHPHMEQMRVILYRRPSAIAVGKQAGTTQGRFGQALETIDRHVSQEWEKGKRQFRPPALPVLLVLSVQPIKWLMNLNQNQQG